MHEAIAGKKRSLMEVDLKVTPDLKTEIGIGVVKRIGILEIPPRVREIIEDMFNTMLEGLFIPFAFLDLKKEVSEKCNVFINEETETVDIVFASDVKDDNSSEDRAILIMRGIMIAVVRATLAVIYAYASGDGKHITLNLTMSGLEDSEKK